MINKFLQSEINARNFFIICIALELVDDSGKTLGFYWKGNKSYSLKNEKRKKEKKKYYYMRNKWTLASYFF